MSAKFLQRLLGEPWLAFNRLLTVRLLRRKTQRREQAEPPYEPVPGRLLYVAASALPYHISGYTTRTHEIVRALQQAGGDVRVLTRPGYPWDRKDRLDDAEHEETWVDDVCYGHARRPANNRPVLQFAVEAAAAVVQAAIRHRVAVIHAASNHVNALPALLAARQLGIPFQYEMRGLWELSRASRMPDFRDSQGFKQGLQLEGLVAEQADRLFVISEQLGRYAHQRWGVQTSRMFLLPNCVDPARFEPADPQDVAPDTIVYAGSLIVYEGLDVLIDAIGDLRDRGRQVTLTIIGDGEARAQLQAQVQQLGLDGHVTFLGRVPPQEARALQARSALVCIPRRPFEVCQIVPPIKLVEAMAMGKPVVVPDLPVFQDEVGGCRSVRFFQAGDSADLARVLDAALLDRQALTDAGAQARQDAVSRRSWRDFVGDVLPVGLDKEEK
ncbi:glycosyltransferase family 4 protein [Alcaligenes sp. WGS1538]|uniref:glycosyltransferase family 4 protein n=1 Tax=Alcaligenes sp. WGS1538 TaxID=3366811 RepID=UPI00372D86DC